MRPLVAAALSAIAIGATASAAGAPARAGGYWIVLGSDRDGRTRAYSVRPDGSRLSPLLARGRALVPLAMSGHGTTIAYQDGRSALYVSRGDGTRLRRLSRGVTVDPPDRYPALSADGRLVAFARSEARGTWIVGADGRGLRRITLEGVQPDWSPDGKALVLTNRESIFVQPVRRARRTIVRGTELTRPKWSPDGSWIAYVSLAERSNRKGLWVVRPSGGQRHRVARDAPSTFAWSPDSRSLAYGRDRGAAVVGVDERRLRALRLGFSTVAVTWSPDGRRLSLAGRTGDDPDQIWVVGRDGRGLRRVTSAGRNAPLGWTRLAPRLPRAAPLPPTERVAAADTVATRAPVVELSADGTRAAFVTSGTPRDCDHVSVWTPAGKALVRLSSRLPAPCGRDTGTVRYAIYDLELAGRRAAWADIQGCGNSCDVALKSATLAGPSPLVVAEGNGGGGAGGGELWDFHLHGHGDLLVFNGGFREPELVRIGSVRATLRRGAHSAFVDSVSGKLIAIRESDAVAVLDEQGKLVRVFPFGREELRAAQLDGGRLVVTRSDVIEVYDVATGAGELQRSLPSDYELVDADGGIAVLRRANEILLLRLGDGRSLTLTPGRRPVLAELEALGLYYSYATASGQGRLVFMPRPEIVRRLGGGSR